MKTDQGDSCQDEAEARVTQLHAKDCRPQSEARKRQEVFHPESQGCVACLTPVILHF